MTSFRRHRRWWVWAAGVFLLAAWLVPSYFSAERYRRRLEVGLEAVVHRPATFGSASFRLLPRPGFSLENVVVHEDPAFGPEPFARIDRVECDLRGRSLWRRRLDFARLRLERPSFNIVRNDRGDWNIESLLVRTGVAREKRVQSGAPAQSPFDIEVDEARLNFKVGLTKKPLAVVDLRARMNLDPTRGRIRFRLSGNPIRTDLPYPAPGIVEFEGEWQPSGDLSGMLNAQLRTRGALLYNWVPLVTGTNPDLYGVIDAAARLSGSLRVIHIEGEASVAQLHRWDLLPPADLTPIRLRYRGAFDRNQKRASLESFEASFANSRLQVNGVVDNIPDSPELDLVVGLARSRLEDLEALCRRLWRYPSAVRLAGRVDGQLTLLGPWQQPRYGGFVGAREVRMITPSVSFPVSELALRVDKNGARLAPVAVSIAPRIALNIEGALHPAEKARPGRKAPLPPRYEIKVAAKSFELREAVRFARALGISSAETVEAQGIGNFTAVLTGVAWPLAQPQLAWKGDVRAARLIIPGLTEPLNIPRARVQGTADRFVFDPITAVVGTSVLTGRVEHQGPKSNPWVFDLKAKALSVEQGAALFDSLGHRPSLPLLERIPGLSSAAARRSAASRLFTALRARGRFETAALTYRSLTLQEFQASVDLSGRTLQLTGVSFRAGGGRGQGKVRLDLTRSPAEISGEVAVADVRLASLSNHLPTSLRQAHGMLSGTARFETRGLSRSEMSGYLQATGSVRLEKVALGDFDPLSALARVSAWGGLEPAQREVTLRRADIKFEIRDGKVHVVDQPVEVEGARLALSGSWTFNGPLELDVTPDFRRMTRRWMAPGAPEIALPSRATVRLTGPFDRIVAHGQETPARAQR